MADNACYRARPATGDEATEQHALPYLWHKHNDWADRPSGPGMVFLIAFLAVIDLHESKSMTGLVAVRKWSFHRDAALTMPANGAHQKHVEIATTVLQQSTIFIKEIRLR